MEEKKKKKQEEKTKTDIAQKKVKAQHTQRTGIWRLIKVCLIGLMIVTLRRIFPFRNIHLNCWTSNLFCVCNS